MSDYEILMIVLEVVGLPIATCAALLALLTFFYLMKK